MPDPSASGWPKPASGDTVRRLRLIVPELRVERLSADYVGKLRQNDREVEAQGVVRCHDGSGSNDLSAAAACALSGPRFFW